jgi:RsiW-degrading membrane proteinase PrsW (M82 family)
MARALAAIALLVLAVGCAVLAYAALKNLWADYQDSPTYVYVVIGGVWCVLGMFLIGVAIRLLRRPRSPRKRSRR